MLAFTLVIAQAILGGMTVLFRLPPQVSIAHAFMAQMFFCTAVVLAFVNTARWQSVWPYENDSRGLQWAALTLTSLFLVQLIFGATLRHYGAALAIPDFPWSFGRVIPDHWSFGIAVNFLHRTQGFVIAIFATFVAFRSTHLYTRDLFLVANAGLIIALVSVQILLGAMAIWGHKPVWITTAHLVNGALCLATSLLLTLQLMRMRFWAPK